MVPHLEFPHTLGKFLERDDLIVGVRRFFSSVAVVVVVVVVRATAWRDFDCVC